MSQPTRSLWTSTADLPRFAPLREDVRADVCVIGAGIAGLTAALYLLRAGRSVVVIDQAGVGAGETARTTAHLASVLDDGFQEVERLHGTRGLRLAYQSQAAAIDAIEAITAEESIDCSFRRVDGYLFLGGNETDAYLTAECEAAERAGCTDCEHRRALDVAGRDLGPCLLFPRQGQFHPLRYLAGLAAAVVRRGATIYESAHAEDVDGGGGDARVTVRGGRTVRAGHVIVATNTPFNDRFVIHTKQAAYRTYAIAAPVARGAMPTALYWDTEDPYHYVRLAGTDPDFVVIGGEDHKTGQDEDPQARFQRLEGWARERFPLEGAVAHRWSGQVMEPVDAVAFIGRNPADEANVYIVTGDSGMGMTHGTIAGMLLTDLIEGRENEWSVLYDPSRVTLRAAGEWASENLNVAAQATALVTPGEVSSAEDVAPGSGAVLRRGVSKIAVYRDESGRIIERSAVCPHLGCIVAWNAAEKSWDCPCHGSRFDPQGRVLNGPSTRDLSGVG